MTTYKYFGRVIKTGKNKDSGVGWCGVIENDMVTNVFGKRDVYETEDALLGEIATQMALFKALIYFGRVSAQPETISLEAEYLV